MLDLDRARADRARRRAIVAAREGEGKSAAIVLDGKTIAVLAPEAPFKALAPLRDIDQEIALLINQAMQMATGGSRMDGASLIVDLLTANPNLPMQLIEVVKNIAGHILGTDGLQAFLDADPSVDDVVALASGIAEHYGLSLGEAGRSSDSQTSGGPTSELTSSASTDSTPEASTERTEPPASSELPTSST